MRYSFFAVKSTRCGMIPFHGRSRGRRSGEGHADDVRPAVGAVRVRRGSGASAVRQDARWPVCRQVVADGLAPAAFVWQSLGRTAAAHCGERQAAFNATRGRVGGSAQGAADRAREWRVASVGFGLRAQCASCACAIGTRLRLALMPDAARGRGAGHCAEPCRFLMLSRHVVRGCRLAGECVRPVAGEPDRLTHDRRHGSLGCFAGFDKALPVVDRRSSQIALLALVIR